MKKLHMKKCIRGGQVPVHMGLIELTLFNINASHLVYVFHYSLYLVIVKFENIAHPSYILRLNW
jgi:hypothetical protein